MKVSIKGQAGETETGVSSPGLKRDSKLPPMLSLSLHPFFSEKEMHDKWNGDRYVNNCTIRVLSWGILTAIAGSSISIIISQRPLRGPQSVAGFPFIPKQYCDNILHEWVESTLYFHKAKNVKYNFKNIYSVKKKKKKTCQANYTLCLVEHSPGR